MSIFLCVLSGLLICVFSACLVKLLVDAGEDNNVTCMSIASLLIALWSVALGAAIHNAVKSPQEILEDFHKGKIETVITTTQYQDNTVKVDTTYRYK